MRRKIIAVDFDGTLLEILLQDHSSGKNIIWATDDYARLGDGYEAQDFITLDKVGIIKRRTQKTEDEQRRRSNGKAEVFTPSWLAASMNSLIDDEWFGRKNVFCNTSSSDCVWTVNPNKIEFSKGKTWRGYVALRVLEITCGEAPFLVSRYDPVTGEEIKVKDRIGLLDRKLRVINENADNEKDWVDWAIKAFKATYGYEWQGDNLLLARENLLLTFIEYYKDKFGGAPSDKVLTEIAEIISWNIWQMDGLKFVIPNSCKPVPKAQISMFGDKEFQECLGCRKGDNKKHTGTYCIIKDWETMQSVTFASMLNN